MALIVCSECGRAVSNKASACIGCGAPITTAAGIDMVPKPTPIKRLSLPVVKRHLLISSIILGLGVIAAIIADHRQAANRLDQFIAALLLIAGISWTLVTLVRLWSYRK